MRDLLIVPGVRMGPVSLGMTEAQLRGAVGDPYNTTDLASGSSLYRYLDLGLDVYVNDRHVYKIVTATLLGDGRRYATREGIGFGSPKSELIAKLGQPKWMRLVTTAWEVYCFEGDTEVRIGVGSSIMKGQLFFVGIGSCDDTTF